MTALSQGYTLLATTVLGGLFETGAHSPNNWQAKADALALRFWNNTITTIGIPSTSLIMATALTESSLGAWNRTTQNNAATELPGQLTLSNIDLAFSYLQSDQFLSTTPPGGKQSHDQCSRISVILAGQPYGAATSMAQTRDTDSQGGNKESTPPGARPGSGFLPGLQYLQSGQVVLGCTAVLDASGGLPQPEPARVTGPAQ